MSPFFDFVLVAALIYFVISRTNSSSSAGNTENVRQSAGTPLDYGNGVYYFPFTEADFGNALSAYLEQNPETRPSSIVPDKDHTYVRGYWVVF